MSFIKDGAKSDLCNSRRVGEAVLPATWSHPDSLEPNVKGRYIKWKWVMNERVESRRWRLYCVKIGFWMNVDFFNPKTHVTVGVIALTIFIFFVGCQHWWLGVAKTSTVGLPLILKSDKETDDPVDSLVQHVSQQHEQI
jgi:hypothetical protein